MAEGSERDELSQMRDGNGGGGKSAFSKSLPQNVEGTGELCVLLVEGRRGKVRGAMWSMCDDRVIAKFQERVKTGYGRGSLSDRETPSTTKDTKVHGGLCLWHKRHPLLEFLE